jgi:folate-dependent phosphoribosylglycinamide formyltransferase PurN
MKAALLALFAGILAMPAMGAEYKVRNVSIVRSGHIHTIVATVYNYSDHRQEESYVSFKIVDEGRVIAREQVKVPALEAGQASRIAQRIHSANQAKVAQAVDDSSAGSDIAIDAKLYPYVLGKK